MYVSPALCLFIPFVMKIFENHCKKQPFLPLGRLAFIWWPSYIRTYNGVPKRKRARRCFVSPTCVRHWGLVIPGM